MAEASGLLSYSQAEARKRTTSLSLSLSLTPMLSLSPSPSPSPSPSLRLAQVEARKRATERASMPRMQPQRRACLVPPPLASEASISVFAAFEAAFERFEAGVGEAEQSDLPMASLPWPPENVPVSGAARLLTLAPRPRPSPSPLTPRPRPFTLSPPVCEQATRAPAVFTPAVHFLRFARVCAYAQACVVAIRTRRVSRGSRKPCCVGTPTSTWRRTPRVSPRASSPRWWSGSLP